jgi:medium-chain acyl-[acyl-carrier-protein] hydrolase
MSASLIRPVPVSAPSVRLFCVPFAGVGPSAFRGWAQALGRDVETFYVQLPGREGRIREQSLSSVAEMTELLVEALLPWLDRPYALMGHSLGGLVAFETAHALRNRVPEPVTLFVSATRAPQLPNSRPPLHGLGDVAMLEAVNARYAGSVPAAVLESPELVELLAPALRADLSALETYSYPMRAPLGCPISVFGGRHDRAVSMDVLEPWAAETTGGFQLRTIEGGHLFLQSALTTVVDAIREDLAPHIQRDEADCASPPATGSFA